MKAKIALLLCFSSLGFAFDYQHQSSQFWQDHLKPAVYDICRESGTERPGSGKYDDFFQSGVYYCACCGGDFSLFSSETKFDSHTGWPSFYAPIPKAVVTRDDPNDSLLKMIGVPRTEVLCSRCLSHLGHVFDDGPPPTGKRYCMNSLALVFYPDDTEPTRTYKVD